MIDIKFLDESQCKKSIEIITYLLNDLWSKIKSYKL